MGFKDVSKDELDVYMYLRWSAGPLSTRQVRLGGQGASRFLPVYLSIFLSV